MVALLALRRSLESCGTETKNVGRIALFVGGSTGVDGTGGNPNLFFQEIDEVEKFRDPA